MNANAKEAYHSLARVNDASKSRFDGTGAEEQKAISRVKLRCRREEEEERCKRKRPDSQTTAAIANGKLKLMRKSRSFGSGLAWENETLASSGKVRSVSD